jgi:hypothetical protein
MSRNIKDVPSLSFRAQNNKYERFMMTNRQQFKNMICNLREYMYQVVLVVVVVAVFVDSGGKS